MNPDPEKSRRTPEITDADGEGSLPGGTHLKLFSVYIRFSVDSVFPDVR